MSEKFSQSSIFLIIESENNFVNDNRRKQKKVNNSLGGVKNAWPINFSTNGLDLEWLTAIWV